MYFTTCSMINQMETSMYTIWVLYLCVFKNHTLYINLQPRGQPLADFLNSLFLVVHSSLQQGLPYFTQLFTFDTPAFYFLLTEKFFIVVNNLSSKSLHNGDFISKTHSQMQIAISKKTPPKSSFLFINKKKMSVLLRILKNI